MDIVIRVPRRTSLERIASSNGRIQVNGIDAQARLETSNGGVRADRIAGGIEVTTSNGGVRVSLAKAEERRPVRLTTSNGSVELSVEELANNDVVVSTSNASITVRLPASVSAAVKASTSNGSITNEFDSVFQGQSENTFLEGRIRTGGPTLSLSTSNGSIRLLKM